MRSCLSPLQAGRKHFDEKLWNGKNETKFDKQHLTVESRRPGPDEMVEIFARVGLEGPFWDPKADQWHSTT